MVLELIIEKLAQKLMAYFSIRGSKQIVQAYIFDMPLHFLSLSKLLKRVAKTLKYITRYCG